MAKKLSRLSTALVGSALLVTLSSLMSTRKVSVDKIPIIPTPFQHSFPLVRQDAPKSACPPLVNKLKGVYSATSKMQDDRFRNVLLLTAANHQFQYYLQNWQIIAGELGLQWVVLSLDNKIYELLGREGILLPEEHQVETAGKFGTSSYIKLVCNKIRVVLNLLHACSVDILFSDVDNVFLKDPFQHHLGSMIASGYYDYIYQTNDDWTPQPGQHSCISEGVSVLEGNSGFHYLRPTDNVKNLLNETLRRCSETNNTFDDQTLLWYVLREGADSGTWHHCQANHTPSATKPFVSQFCCLDPHFYPTGRRQPLNPNALITFHANWGARVRKKGKLKSWVKGGWRLPWG